MIPTRTFGSPLVTFHASRTWRRSNSASCFATTESGFRGCSWAGAVNELASSANSTPATPVSASMRLLLLRFVSRDMISPLVVLKHLFDAYPERRGQSKGQQQRRDIL